MPDDKKRPNELKVLDVKLLEEIFEKSKREAKFYLEINKLTSENVKIIIDIIKENPGNQPFSMLLVDKEHNMTCSTHPEKGKINAEAVFKKMNDYADLVTYDLLK